MATDPSPFEAAARQRRGLLREYFDLLRYHKKYWLAPIIGVLLTIGALLVLGGSAAAPLIYAIF
jgi:hypothetical protein